MGPVTRAGIIRGSRSDIDPMVHPLLNDESFLYFTKSHKAAHRLLKPPRLTRSVRSLSPAPRQREAHGSEQAPPPPCNMTMNTKLKAKSVAVAAKVSTEKGLTTPGVI